MNTKQPDDIIEDDDILLENDKNIQACKIQRKQPTNKNAEPRKPEYLNYEQVMELIKNNSPLIDNEMNKPRKKRETKKEIIINDDSNPPTPPTPPTPPAPPQQDIKELIDVSKIRKKREKKPPTEKQLMAIKKACEVRDANREANRKRKEELQAEYDRLYQEKIIKKAVSIKKAQLKREKELEKIKDEPITKHPEPKVSSAIIAETNIKLKPKTMYKFY